MKVLVACEWSGTVRDAFRDLGHEAYSCDTAPEDWNVADFRCDVRSLFSDHWDLLIAHPPCTALTVAGNRWYYDKPDLIQEALSFFLDMYNAPVSRVCVENPVGRVSTLFRPPDQYIQPYEFGHGETKKTGLWLRGLPKLVPTNIVNGRDQRVWRMAPSSDRSRLRGKTYAGIAEAMAKQWGAE